MKRLILISIVFLSMACGITALAAVPNKINFQGRLLNSIGDPLDTTATVTFSIYNVQTDGAALWTEVHPDVVFSEGVFTVLLGSITPIPTSLFAGANRHLGISLDGGTTELTPRTKFGVVPYAFRVGTVDGTTGGVISGDVTIQNNLDVNGELDVDGLINGDGDLMINGKATIGQGHAITGTDAFVAGEFNDATGPYSVISGGQGNRATSSYSTIGGGILNRADSVGTVGGGYLNHAAGIYSVVAGGGSEDDSNVALGDFSAILGGKGHLANGFANAIGGGAENFTDGDYSTISGGLRNFAISNNSTVGGGRNNTSDSDGTVAGGRSNYATGRYAFVGGGISNRARGFMSVVSGGGGGLADSNAALGAFSTVPGGTGNFASGNYSFAAGYRARAKHLGTFVWSDSSGSPFASTDENQFLIRASGGVGIGTDSPTVALHVKQSGIPSVLLQLEQKGAGAGSIMRFVNNSATHGYLMGQTYDGSDHSFVIANSVSPFTKYFAIDTSGNVGIGTLTPAAPFHVAGQTQIDDDLIVAGTGIFEGKLEVFTDPPSSPPAALIRANSTGGEMLLYNSNTSNTIEIDAGFTTGGGAVLQLYDLSGAQQRITLFAGDPAGGGRISLYNDSGAETIKLDGAFTSGASGVGRIITDELEITAGADVAEYFSVSGKSYASVNPVNDHWPTDPEPGMVVCIDPTSPGNLMVSTIAYDRCVAGIISGAGEINTGMILGQSGSVGDGDQPIALAGRVYCLANASNGPIRPGDLLTTSDTPGHAMKVTDFREAQGAVLGKAMTSLNRGTGLVLILVSLQ